VIRRALLPAVAAAEFLTAVVLVVFGAYWSAVMFAGMGVVVFSAATLERVAWLSGYFRGRSAMLASLSDAIARDMTLAEWITAEGERDSVIAAQYRRRRPLGRRQQSKRRS
jgi:hypothetical protein